MTHFNINTFLAGERDHFETHGFHWHHDSHLIDTYSLRQEFLIALHPEEVCETSEIQIQMTVPWSAETQLEWLRWSATCEEADEVPDHFLIEPSFEFQLPLLDTPPELMDVWMALISECDKSVLTVNVSASDHIESPMDRSRRTMRITAQATIPLREIVCVGWNQDEDTVINPMCAILDDLHRLSIFLLERLPQWCRHG